MSPTDRPTRSLPDLMAELAPPRVPDYFDDMLKATARTRQRPAWTSLERLLPWFNEVSTQIEAGFSPDGTKLLVTYGDGSTWLYSVPDGNGAKVEWPAVVNASWQRLAP